MVANTVIIYSKPLYLTTNTSIINFVSQELLLDICWIFLSYSHATIGVLIRHRFLESFGDLPCESCNNIVLFNFDLIIVRLF